MLHVFQRERPKRWSPLLSMPASIIVISQRRGWFRMERRRWLGQQSSTSGVGHFITDGTYDPSKLATGSGGRRWSRGLLLLLYGLQLPPARGWCRHGHAHGRLVAAAARTRRRNCRYRRRLAQNQWWHSPVPAGKVAALP